MPRKDVITELNRFFEDAQKNGLTARDGGRHIRTDGAINLSLGDVINSELSPQLRALVVTGLMGSSGVMMTKMVRHQPEGEKNGQINFELAGAGNRFGGELVASCDPQGESDHLRVGPSLKLMMMGHSYLFSEFRNRPKDVQEQDALALVALARKAIGLQE